MDVLKKWIGSIVSFVAGVLGLAMSACSGMVAKTTVAGVDNTETHKAFKVITDADLKTQADTLGITSEFTWLKAFSIVMLVVAIVLIVYSIVLLLKNVNVIKSDSQVFDIINIVLSVVLLITAIVLMVVTNTYAGALETATTSVLPIEMSVKMGLYQPFMLAVSIFAVLLNVVFEIIKRKRA